MQTIQAQIQYYTGQSKTHNLKARLYPDLSGFMIWKFFKYTDEFCLYSAQTYILANIM